MRRSKPEIGGRSAPRNVAGRGLLPGFPKFLSRSGLARLLLAERARIIEGRDPRFLGGLEWPCGRPSRVGAAAGRGVRTGGGALPVPRGVSAPRVAGRAPRPARRPGRGLEVRRVFRRRRGSPSDRAVG